MTSRRRQQITVRLSGLLALTLAACSSTTPPSAPPPRPAPEPEEPAEPEEDDDDDGVAIDGLKGTLEAADIQPVIEAAWNDVWACYQDHGGKKQRYLGGKLELAFRVARDGSVLRVAANGASDLGAWPVEKCVLGVAAQLRFPKPKGGEAEFSFPIEFTGRGKVSPMDEGWATTSLGKQLAQLDTCGTAGTTGAVRITFYVAPGGKIAEAGFAVDGDQPLLSEFAECAYERALKWKVKDPRGSILKGTVTVSTRGA